MGTPVTSTGHSIKTCTPHLISPFQLSASTVYTSRPIANCRFSISAAPIISPMMPFVRPCITGRIDFLATRRVNHSENQIAATENLSISDAPGVGSWTKRAMKLKTLAGNTCDCERTTSTRMWMLRRTISFARYVRVLCTKREIIINRTDSWPGVRVSLLITTAQVGIRSCVTFCGPCWNIHGSLHTRQIWYSAMVFFAIRPSLKAVWRSSYPVGFVFLSRVNYDVLIGL